MCELTAVVTVLSVSLVVEPPMTTRARKVKNRPTIISPVVFPALFWYLLHWWSGLDDIADHCRYR